MPKPREIETYINEQTLKDLIIQHLHNITVIKNYEEVKDLIVTEQAKDGLRKLVIRFEPDIQTIFHP